MAKLFQIPQNHPQRFVLHNEVHARASSIPRLPVRASYLALTLSNDEKILERPHLKALCERFGVIPPGNDADHFSASFDAFQMSWEQHGEFSTYTFYAYDATDEPFEDPALSKVPVDWLARIGGQTIVAAHAAVVSAEEIRYQDETDLSPLTAYFVGNAVAGSKVTGGAASVFTDFRIHVDGFSRFLVVNHELKTAQAGRLLHRLFDIEVYRVLALLAFPIARKQYPELKKADRQLYAITNSMTQPDADDAKLLDELTALAAEVENQISSHQFRFAAASAYHQLVGQRLTDLREVRIQGIQTLGEFLKRRLDPAMTTCNSLSHRFNLVSERVSNASQLLRTKVDIIIERQNQGLLSSMALRAKMQLRLQQTVESISIVAIAYYAASLTGKIAEGLHAAGWPIDPALVEAAAIPFILVIIAIGTKLIHKNIADTTDL
ncbi:MULTISPECIES: DUF3422 domain-containing protein [Methylomonas]|uniref:Egg lysin n=1 Tax=Methylomonas koyamae TaxID=702114 RepID=A0A177N0D3_9GAMM|nr:MULTISPECIES: DUF3422 domain-containing protein [Methylomonas]NJA06835.1 DUF3422 domain-containing protein [Methylococcaceae bacterium WWC4]OAI11428.1 hypothetical protein A1355_16045 [Methylomonas koyamae]WGS87977.1 DUF3422 domain-containing protein [Methylomonas sp. UP202]